jgi:hypothetical protein
VVTAYNPGGRAAAEVDNGAAARALWADPRLEGLVLLPSFGGHPDGAWLEPGLPSSGLSRHQARVLGHAYGQLAVYELDGAIRRVVACDRDRVLVQAVVCQRERQPPTSKPSPRPEPAQQRGDPGYGAQAHRPPAWRQLVGPPGRRATGLGSVEVAGRLGGEVCGWAVW